MCLRTFCLTEKIPTAQVNCKLKRTRKAMQNLCYFNIEPCMYLLQRITYLREKNLYEIVSSFVTPFALPAKKSED